MDWIGTVLCLGLATTLLLALQWGGTTKPWSSPTIIVLFVVFGALLVLFVAWEAYLGPRALLPFRIMGRRTQIGSCLESVRPHLFVSSLLLNLVSLQFWLLLCMIVAIVSVVISYFIQTVLTPGVEVLSSFLVRGRVPSSYALGLTL